MAVDRTAGRLSSLIRRKFTSRPLLHVLVVLGSDHSCLRDAAELARSSNARLTVVQSWHVSRFFWGLGAFGFVPVSLETLTRDAAEDACARVKRLVASMDTGPVTFRCRKGPAWLLAVRESATGNYDVIATDSRFGSFAANARWPHAWSQMRAWSGRPARLLTPSSSRSARRGRR